MIDNPHLKLLRELFVKFGVLSRDQVFRVFSGTLGRSSIYHYLRVLIKRREIIEWHRHSTGLSLYLAKQELLLGATGRSARQAMPLHERFHQIHHRLAINPFLLPQGCLEPSPQKTKFLLALLETILTDADGDKIPKLDKSLLEEAILKTYLNCGSSRAPRFSDFAEILRSSDEQSLRNYAKMLYPWTGIPYQIEQQQSFKSYFGQIEEIAVRLAQDSAFTKAFNDGLRALDIGATCAKVFIPKTEWQTLMSHCLVEGFFLCSDEVKFYPDLVKGIRAKLSPDLQQKFDQAQSCRASQ